MTKTFVINIHMFSSLYVSCVQVEKQHKSILFGCIATVWLSFFPRFHKMIYRLPSLIDYSYYVILLALGANSFQKM